LPQAFPLVFFFLFFFLAFVSETGSGGGGRAPSSSEHRHGVVSPGFPSEETSKAGLSRRLFLSGVSLSPVFLRLRLCLFSTLKSREPHPTSAISPDSFSEKKRKTKGKEKKKSDRVLEVLLVVRRSLREEYLMRIG
jgi:hypothetical protein